MNRYHSALRSILRQLFVHSWPGPMHAKRHIVVVGLPRSGTSWLAKAISLVHGVSYYFEPDQRLGKAYWYKYVPAVEQDELLRSHIKMAFRGRIVDEYTISEQGGREILAHPRSHTVLLKWVFLSLCLEWISKYFSELTVVQIIRHPVPQFLSWQQRGWDPDYNLQLLLNQPKLMKGPLQPYASVMHQAETYWEKVGAFWGAITYMQLRVHRTSWFLLEHEWFCLDANTRFRWLVEKLGLQWNTKIEDFLSPQRKIISGPGYGKRRDSRSEVHKWESQVTQKELDELMGTIAHFELPFYRNLDPEAHCTTTLHEGLDPPSNG